MIRTKTVTEKKDREMSSTVILVVKDSRYYRRQERAPFIMSVIRDTPGMSEDAMRDEFLLNGIIEELVPQGRDQGAKLTIFVRIETHNLGRSHQSPVRSFTTTVNGALSSIT